jgi:4-hydroxy-tetrahydrodipicolinate reductase
MSAVRVAIAGAGGRMGRALLDAATTTDGVTLGAALDLPGTAWAGRDAGDLCSNAEGITVDVDVNSALDAAGCPRGLHAPRGNP